MAKPIVALLFVVVLAFASDARGGERRSERGRLHLAPEEMASLLDARPADVPRAAADLRLTAPLAVATLALIDTLTSQTVGLPPFFTLLAPAETVRRDRNETTPLLAFGARVQGRTLVAFTRPGAKVDPDDRVVYQRLVASDLFQGRRFSVTVYEDHALGGSGSQLVGFGARLMLRPSLSFHGWRTRVEIFTSYDVTQGVTGYLGFIGRPPPAPAPARALLPVGDSIPALAR